MYQISDHQAGDHAAVEDASGLQQAQPHSRDRSKERAEAAEIRRERLANTTAAVLEDASELSTVEVVIDEQQQQLRSHQTAEDDVDAEVDHLIWVDALATCQTTRHDDGDQKGNDQQDAIRVDCNGADAGDRQPKQNREHRNLVTSGVVTRRLIGRCYDVARGVLGFCWFLGYPGPVPGTERYHPW